MVQHIHSLRARGVISSHAAKALGAEARDFCKSAGSLCAVPSEIFLVINLYYQPALIGAPMRIVTIWLVMLHQRKRKHYGLQKWRSFILLMLAIDLPEEYIVHYIEIIRVLAIKA
jgi:hypothetical protein